MMKREFTTREKVMLVVLAVLLLVVGYAKLILEPINQQIETYQAETQNYQMLITAEASKAAQLSQLQQKVDALRESGQTRQIPEYDNLQKVMTQLNGVLGAASEYALSFGATSSIDYVFVRPMSITFTANSYADARAIIQQLNDGYMNQISSMTCAFTRQDSATVMQVSLEITYYERMN